MSARRALITGVTGQDGVHLARHLAALGYDVVGTVSTKLAHQHDVYLPPIDRVLLDLHSVSTATWRMLLERTMPDEVYHLAGPSAPGESWGHPFAAQRQIADATQRLLAAAATVRSGAGLRVLVAGSAVEDGSPIASPYAQAKAAARRAVESARDGGLFVCMPRLHNHESPLRSTRFVTRKISQAVAEIAEGQRTSLELGNIAARRDWSSAADVVRALHQTLQGSVPTDPDIGSGRLTRLSDLVEAAFLAAGIPDSAPYLRIDNALIRSHDPDPLPADVDMTARLIGWRPTVTATEVMSHLVRVDLERLRSGCEHDVSYLKEIHT